MPQTLFTSRNGGVSAAPFDSFNLALHVGDDPELVRSNRNRLAKQIGITRDRIFFMNQVHGNAVASITESSTNEIEPTADALFTCAPGRALVVLVADCTPLLLKSSRAVAAVHVGRRGLVSEVMEATLELFDRAGVKRSEIAAELGPSICANCYQVDAQTYDEVVAKNSCSATTKEQSCLDINSGLRANLTRAGVTFTSLDICVKHESGYFSYRNENRTGRQAGVVWL